MSDPGATPLPPPPRPAPTAPADQPGPHPAAPDPVTANAPGHASDNAEDHTPDIASGHGCLVALQFREPLMAQEALLAAMRLRGGNRLGLQDAAIVARHAGGRVRIQQTKDLDTLQGASSGLWFGILAGLFFPEVFLLTGALGAAVGGLWAKLRDIGISDKRMKELAEALPEGQAALFMLIDQAHRFHALAELRRFPATLFYDTLPERDRGEVVEALAGGVVDHGY